MSVQFELRVKKSLCCRKTSNIDRFTFAMRFLVRVLSPPAIFSPHVHLNIRLLFDFKIFVKLFDIFAEYFLIFIIF